MQELDSFRGGLIRPREQWVIKSKDYYHLTWSTLRAGLKRHQLMGQRTGNPEGNEWVHDQFLRKQLWSE